MMDPWEDRKLYLDDPVSRIAGVGEGIEKSLKDYNIMTVADLHGLNQQTMKSIAKTTRGFGLSLLDQCMENSKHVSPCNAPVVIHYIDTENPFAAKFGTDVNEWGKEAWVKQIKKSSAFRGVRCITDLVKHMVIKTKKYYDNTSYKNTYHSYHDALSQLTHDTTVRWLRKTKIPDEDTVVYKRWIKPENGLNNSFGPRWKQRPIGNSPKLMPLDNLLNQDVHKSVQKHTVMSLTLHREWKNDSLFFNGNAKGGVTCLQVDL
jgi:hypothetical protein